MNQCTDLLTISNIAWALCRPARIRSSTLITIFLVTTLYTLNWVAYKNTKMPENVLQLMYGWSLKLILLISILVLFTFNNLFWGNKKTIFSSKVKMSSDFNFTVTFWFLGNLHVKPYFNTQCPSSHRVPTPMSVDSVSQTLMYRCCSSIASHYLYCEC